MIAFAHHDTAVEAQIKISELFIGITLLGTANVVMKFVHVDDHKSYQKCHHHDVTNHNISVVGS